MFSLGGVAIVIPFTVFAFQPVSRALLPIGVSKLHNPLGLLNFDSSNFSSFGSFGLLSQSFNIQSL